MATARGDAGEGEGARGAGLLQETREAGGWPERLTEDEWYARLHERYVRRVPKARGGAREAALLLYRAGARLQWATRFCCTPEKAYYKPIRLSGCALGLRCPDSSNCIWCNCALWPCACGTEQRVDPPRPVPKGLSRRNACGGRDLGTRLQRAAAEGCLCPLRSTGAALCPADRLDLMCDKGREQAFEARRRMRKMAEERERDLGIWKEDFAAENFVYKGRQLRSVATQVVTASDDKTLFVGEGRIIRGKPELRRERLRAASAAGLPAGTRPGGTGPTTGTTAHGPGPSGVASGAATQGSGPADVGQQATGTDYEPFAPGEADDHVHEIEVKGLGVRGRIGIIDFTPKPAPAAVEDEYGTGSTVYDLRGVKLSLEELASHTTIERRGGWLQRVFSFLKWDAITRKYNIKIKC